MRKPEYDRKNQKRIYQNYMAERAKILEILGDRCACCYRTDCQLHLHHKIYDEHSSYPRTSNGWSRIKRVKEALKSPTKFILVCPRCHIVFNNIDKMGGIQRLLTLLSPPN